MHKNIIKFLAKTLANQEKICYNKLLIYTVIMHIRRVKLMKVTRREARITAIELLFDYTFNRDSTLEERIELALDNRELKYNDFSEKLFKVTVEHMDEIDEKISSLADNWSFERISNLAKCIIRMCACEMMYLDTPIEIAINEAVEITKLYDDQKAVSFINGVLGGIAKTL